MSSSTATSSPDGEARRPHLVLGEVQTCLIQNSDRLPSDAVTALMQIIPGMPVSSVTRPVQRAVSPERVTGVDCRLAVAREGRARAIGTVLSHAVTTGGRILQGSSHVTLCDADSGTRQRWQHYLRQPGAVEVTGLPEPNNVLDGFLRDSKPHRGLDLSSITERIIEDVQHDDRLDHRTALRSGQATVRWAARLEPGATPAVGISKRDAGYSHRIRLTADLADLPILIRFCEEFALHEWLLTTVQEAVVNKAERDIAGRRDPLRPLLFALNQLVPLWMPPTYLDAGVTSMWEAVDARTHYSQQFRNQVDRVRDLRAQVMGLASHR